MKIVNWKKYYTFEEMSKKIDEKIKEWAEQLRIEIRLHNLEYKINKNLSIKTKK